MTYPFTPIKPSEANSSQTPAPDTSILLTCRRANVAILQIFFLFFGEDKD